MCNHDCQNCNGTPHPVKKEKGEITKMCYDDFYAKHEREDDGEVPGFKKLITESQSFRPNKQKRKREYVLPLKPQITDNWEGLGDICK